jgi:Fe2+ or Zn2+ uptake regulation protein
MTDTEQFATALDRAGYAMTEPRRVVATLVEQRDGHFTALDLVNDARHRRLGVGRATIFRALELFGELGLVERLDLPNGEHAYVACEPQHHHHVVCKRCGRGSEIADCGIDELAAAVERQTGYAIDTHRFELFGLCPNCRAQAPASPARASSPALRQH